MTNNADIIRLLSLKIEPKTAVDQERLTDALKQLTSDDPTFAFIIDPESGETIIHGQGELHLDIKIHQLIHEHGIGVVCGAPQVAYRETLARSAEIDYTHKKVTGGARQLARVILDLEPNGRGQGNVFENTITEGAVPDEFILAVEKGVRSVWDNGTLIGFPMVDMKVRLYDTAYHGADSSTTAFEIAARAAMKEGCEKGGVHILEPVMKVELEVPQACLRPVLTDIDGRRGKVSDKAIRSDAVVIHAHIPLANMFGYASDLRALTGGRGSHVMHFDHYAIVPRSIGRGPDDFPPAVGMRA